MTISLAATLPLAAALVAAPAAPPKPTLVVLLTVDQMRADYLERFGPQFTGGLRRLMDGGMLFTNAHHDHAITETAPGHASLLSGRFPRSTGITANAFGVEDTSMKLVAGPGPGASPARFRGTALFDWMQKADGRSRALSVSMKDRGAILPVGRARQMVYWYAADGQFTTSRYYADSLPGWLREVNARAVPRLHEGDSWTLLLPADRYPEPDSVPYESGGRDFVFPHLLAPGPAAPSVFRFFPWMDELTVAAALAGVAATGLGAGPQTDLLAVSLSATDLIGHRYGPDSREVHDQVLRLDRMLGTLLDSLYRMRDSTRILVVLTGDHGVQAIPELAAQRGNDRAVRVRLDEAVDSARAVIRAGQGNPNALDVESGAVFLDRAAAGKRQVGDSALAVFARVARRTLGVQRVDRFEGLEKAPPTDVVARRWAQMFPKDFRPALVVTLEPGSIWGYGIVATHGSPHPDDSHVPILFFGAPFAHGRSATFVRTVDIAPTLAQVLGVKPLEALDGVPLAEAVR